MRNRSRRWVLGCVSASLSIATLTGCGQSPATQPAAVTAPSSTTSITPSPGDVSSPPPTTATSTPVASPSTSRTTSVIPAGEPRCSPEDLSAKETGGGSVMNQPWSIITVTNTSGRACTLHGYPTITAAWTRQGRYPVDVLDAGIYEVMDPTPTLFSVAPRGHAWFAAGTGMGYEGPLLTFTEVAVATDAHTSVGRSLHVPVALGATGRKGQPYGITVTAFAPGTGPRN